MAKPGRPKSTFQLSTGNDPSLWRYGSLQEALCTNVGFIANLIDPEVLFNEREADVPINTNRSVKKEKSRKR